MRTFVLGAGFSAYQGYPLVRTLKQKVLEFVRTTEHPAYSVFLRRGNGGYPNGQFFAGLERIDVGGALGFEELLPRLSEALADAVDADPAHITRKVLRIGCVRLLWSINDSIAQTSESYRAFARVLCDPVKPGNVVTFNWDLQSERSLFDIGRSWKYSEGVGGGTTILKPHGSINWNGYLRDNTLVPDYQYWKPIGVGSKLSYDSKSPLKNPFEPPINFHELSYNIFPGDPDLPGSDADLALIWRDVESVLSRSDTVVFIGYSLPEYDSFAVRFFKRLLDGKRIEVYNPSDGDRQKYRNIFGAVAVNEPVRFEQCPYSA